ncbi:DUF6470 family protein [Natroniella sp. ANB-PHB2]|uniref:DUF6470 family protein n=1 Tax=Natroniella sp. ANB-PHB2 TaxID=3384444 RepID=UPI0038D4BE53
MRIPQLNISQRSGQIGVNKITGSFQMDAQLSEMNVTYDNPRPFQVVGDVEIDNPSAIVEIDRSSFLEDLGIRKFNSYLNFLEEQAHQKVSQGIDQIVQEGERLARIENQGDPIAQIAREKFDGDRVEIRYNVSSPADINITREDLNVDVNQARIRVDLNFSYPQVEARGDKYEVYLAEEPELSIEVDYRA